MLVLRLPHGDADDKTDDKKHHHNQNGHLDVLAQKVTLEAGRNADMVHQRTEPAAIDDAERC